MSTNVNAAHILGRITVKGRLQLASPLLIGEGASGEERGDKDIHILRSKDGIPFIPATSLAGALRSFVEADEPRAAQILFGSMNERRSDAQESEGERQSSVSLYDVELPNAVMGMRDGVHIDPVLGTAVAHGKYDYEIVESGAGGIFYAEIILPAVHEKDADILKKALTHLRDLLRGGFHVGALTTKGFGRMYLRDMEIDCYDFRDAKNVIAWLAPERRHPSCTEPTAAMLAPCRLLLRATSSSLPILPSQVLSSCVTTRVPTERPTRGRTPMPS